jgi:hypothetical protein
MLFEPVSRNNKVSPGRLYTTLTDHCQSIPSCQQGQGFYNGIKKPGKDPSEARSKARRSDNDDSAQVTGDILLGACSEGDPSIALVTRTSHVHCSTPDCGFAMFCLPSPSLASAEQQQHTMLSYATYWHSYCEPTPTVNPKNNWTLQYKGLCKRAFWSYAQKDHTLLQIFIAFAAAKEATVRNRQESRVYLVQKSKTLAMLMKDIRGKLSVRAFGKMRKP